MMLLHIFHRNSHHFFLLLCLLACVSQFDSYCFPPLSHSTILISVFLLLSCLATAHPSPFSFHHFLWPTIDITGLIAASFGTVVYNGFYCQPKLTLFYCTTNMLCGALGSYLPFQRWFNERRNKVSFFVLFFLEIFKGFDSRDST